MQAKHIKTFEIDKTLKNYDYSKFAVFSDRGRFLTNIYKHDDVFYTLFDRTPYDSIDDCLKGLKTYIKEKR